MKTCLVGLLLFARVVLAAEPVRVVVDLIDGSRLAGTTTLPQLELQSEVVGKLAVPLDKVQRVSLAPGRSAVVRLSNGDELRAEPVGEGLALKTLVGPVAVAWRLVKEARFVGSAVAAPQEGLVLYFPFDNDEGDVVQDASPSGLRGAVNGARWVAAGRWGGAMEFDGARAHIAVRQAKPLDGLAEALTVAAWVNMAEDIAYERDATPNIVAKGAIWSRRYADFALLLFDAAGAATVEHADEAGQPQHAPARERLPAGRWVHLAATFDAGESRLYVDGRLQRSVTLSSRRLRTSTEPLYIGCRYQNPQRGPFKGLIDEVRVYSRALTEAEIQALADAAVAK